MRKGAHYMPVPAAFQPPRDAWRKWISNDRQSAVPGRPFRGPAM